MVSTYTFTGLMLTKVLVKRPRSISRFLILTSMNLKVNQGCFIPYVNIVLCVLFSNVSYKVQKLANSFQVVQGLFQLFSSTVHIFFDDAFEPHEEYDQDFTVNSFVKQFVRVMQTAVR